MTYTRNVNKFLEAQNCVYDTALKEIRNGKKINHWMWFIFPQVSGLGFSEIAKFYAIEDKIEASAYLNHPVLGERLIECCSELLKLENNDAIDIFETVDSFRPEPCLHNLPVGVQDKLIAPYFQKCV